MENSENTPEITVSGPGFTDFTTNIKVNEPKITAIKWIDTKGENIEKVKYGKEISIRISTEDAYSCNCNVFIDVHCDAWKQNHVQIAPVAIKSGPYLQGKEPEETILTFTPKTEWLKPDSAASNEMTAKVYILYNTLNQTPSQENKLRQMAEAFKDKNKYRTFSSLYSNNVIRAEKESEKITLSKIVIVIDPGHGYYPGTTGTTCRKFHYYLKDEKGKKSEETKHVDAFNLPEYVLKDIDTWIKAVDGSMSEKKYQEWFYVIDIALLLKQKLEDLKIYKVLLTRDVETVANNRKQIESTDVFQNRIDVANNNDADYFISIHCDGTGSFKNSGAFVLYPKDNYSNSNNKDIESSKQFGLDLMNNYTVITPESKKVIQPTDEKSVFDKRNMTQRRVIVELGRMTNPHDILALYEKGNQEKIAEQLKNGIIYNIINRYGKE